MARGLLAWLVQPRRAPGRRGHLSWDLQKEEVLLCEVGEEHCRLWVAESLACFRTYRCLPWGREVMQGLGATWRHISPHLRASIPILPSKLWQGHKPVVESF